MFVSLIWSWFLFFQNKLLWDVFIITMNYCLFSQSESPHGALIEGDDESWESSCPVVSLVMSLEKLKCVKKSWNKISAIVKIY